MVLHGRRVFVLAVSRGLDERLGCAVHVLHREAALATVASRPGRV